MAKMNTKKYFVYAVILHVILLGFFLIKMKDGGAPPKVQAIQAAATPQIQAQTVDAGALQQQINKIKQQEAAKQQAELDSQQKMKALQSAAKRAELDRKKEEAHIKNLKAQADAENKKRVQEEKIQQQKLAAIKEQQNKEQENLTALTKQQEKLKKETAAKNADAKAAEIKATEAKRIEKENQKLKEMAEVETVKKTDVKKPEKTDDKKEKKNDGVNPAEEKTKPPAPEKPSSTDLSATEADKNSQKSTANAEKTVAAKSSSSEIDPKYLGIIEQYRGLITGAIQRNWLVPNTIVNKALACRLYIRLGAGGTVLNVTVQKSSGDETLDRSAIAAVYKASPLPVPNEPALAEQFKELIMDVRPEEIMGE